MKRNKKINDTHSWKKWVQSQDFSKSFFVFIILLILLGLSIFIIWKRYTEGGSFKPQVLLRTSLSQNKNVPSEEKKEMTFQVEVKSLSDRLMVLENSVLAHQQKNLEIPKKLIAVELLRAVLEGIISLETLKTFLQKNQEPWAQSLFGMFGPINESKTYPQLEALFILQKAPSVSLWERVKEKIKSLIHIQKLDAKEKPRSRSLKDVQKALRMHDVEKALECYENLSSQEKEQLASWKEMAEMRSILERALKKLLSELTEG